MSSENSDTTNSMDYVVHGAPSGPFDISGGSINIFLSNHDGHKHKFPIEYTDFFGVNDDDDDDEEIDEEAELVDAEDIEDMNDSDYETQDDSDDEFFFR